MKAYWTVRNDRQLTQHFHCTSHTFPCSKEMQQVTELKII